MAERLSWNEIRKMYDGEWVQLVDFDWEMTESDPRSGVVRVHSKDKREFHQLLKTDPVGKSAVLFVGDMFHSDASGIFNANQHQWFGVR